MQHPNNSIVMPRRREQRARLSHVQFSPIRAIPIDVYNSLVRAPSRGTPVAIWLPSWNAGGVQ